MKVELSTPAKRDLGKLSPFDRKLVIRELVKLRKGQPIDLKKLKGSDNLWRIRAGDYRTIFEQWRPDEKSALEAFVTRVVQRRDAYK